MVNSRQLTALDTEGREAPRGCDKPDSRLTKRPLASRSHRKFQDLTLDDSVVPNHTGYLSTSPKLKKNNTMIFATFPITSSTCFPKLPIWTVTVAHLRAIQSSFWPKQSCCGRSLPRCCKPTYNDQNDDLGTKEICPSSISPTGQ